MSTTRTYADRLATLEAVRQAGISVCAGGIIGLGEGQMDRVGLLHQVGRAWLWLVAGLSWFSRVGYGAGYPAMHPDRGLSTYGGTRTTPAMRL